MRKPLKPSAVWQRVQETPVQMSVCIIGVIDLPFELLWNLTPHSPLVMAVLVAFFVGSLITLLSRLYGRVEFEFPGLIVMVGALICYLMRYLSYQHLSLPVVIATILSNGAVAIGLGIRAYVVWRVGKARRAAREKLEGER